MSHVGVTETEKTVIVLREKKVQTLFIKNMLPLSGDTDMQRNAFVECIRDLIQLISHCHYTMCQNSKYVTGDVTVGIVYKIPIESVHVLLGNDFAGGQVDIILCPVLCEKPVIDDTCKLSVGESELYPE